MSSMLTTGLMTIGFSLWIAAVAVLLASAVVSVVLHPRLRRTSIPDTLPSISLIRPVAGLEYRMEDVTASCLRQDHPDCRVIFAISSPQDPALPLIQEACQLAPQTSCIVVNDQDRYTNPKLTNMAAGFAVQQAEFVFFSDSNTLLPANTARYWQAQALALGGVISALPEGVDPRSLAAWTECAFFTHQFRLNTALDWIGMPSAHGKGMTMSVIHLQTLGGLDALSRYSMEDYALAVAATQHSIPARVSEVPARIPLGRRSWSEVWRRQKRWGQYRAAHAPIGIWLELPILMIPAGTAGALSGAALLGVAPLVLFGGHVLGWLLVDLAIAKRRNQPLGIAFVCGCLIREVLNPVALVLGFFDRSVDWRGHVFQSAKTS
ncbi:MAG: glycosyltransferase [Alphaproteobacteria bacterium]|nr:glycosyltransferase [Alphaproteobacteria bacterium]